MLFISKILLLILHRLLMNYPDKAAEIKKEF